MACTFQPAKLTHVGPIATKMRNMDRIECEALGRSPKDALRFALRCSQDAWTVFEGGRPISMMGVVSDGLLAGTGQVWFLGTDDCFRHARDLMTYGPLFFERWLKPFSELHNIVAVDNILAIRMLQRWGFEFGKTRQVHRGVEFMPFSLERMEPVAGIEPASAPYEEAVLPLN